MGTCAEAKQWLLFAFSPGVRDTLLMCLILSWGTWLIFVCLGVPHPCTAQLPPVFSAPLLHSSQKMNIPPGLNSASRHGKTNWE